MYESSGLTTSLLSTVYAAVPERNITSECSFLTDIEFTSELRQTHNHDGVGSGMCYLLYLLSVVNCGSLLNVMDSTTKIWLSIPVTDIIVKCALLKLLYSPTVLNWKFETAVLTELFISDENCTHSVVVLALLALVQ